jgi:SOS response regulatory protein OraA/RecX
MQEIDGSDYEKTIQRLIEKKYALLQSEKNQFVLFKKLNQYLLQKGFESDVIQDLIKIYLKENQYA